jgi:hypothetical protein
LRRRRADFSFSEIFIPAIYLRKSDPNFFDAGIISSLVAEVHAAISGIAKCESRWVHLSDQLPTKFEPIEVNSIGTT